MGLRSPLTRNVRARSAHIPTSPLRGEVKRPKLNVIGKCPDSVVLACRRRDVAEHPSLRVDENNAVSGRVAGVIFHFLPGNRDAAPEGNGGDGAMSGDDGDVVVAFDLEVIGLIGVGIATA